MTDPGSIEAATAAVLALVHRAGLTATTGGDVLVRLTALLPEQGLRPSAGTDPVRFRVRYLCAAARPDDDGALDRLLRATLDGPYQPVFEPVTDGLWAALGLPPRPAFHLDVPGYLDRPAPVVPRVSEPLRVEATQLRALPGRVVGPGGVPLAGMRVALADGTAATHTDSTGAFLLTGLPAGRDLRLQLSGRGLRFHTEITAQTAVPAVIRCELQEV